MQEIIEVKFERSTTDDAFIVAYPQVLDTSIKLTSNSFTTLENFINKNFRDQVKFMLKARVQLTTKLRYSRCALPAQIVEAIVLAVEDFNKDDLLAPVGVTVFSNIL